MSNIKRYKVTHSFQHEMIVEIDHDIITEESMKTINEFWGDSERRLYLAHNDLTKMTLMNLATIAFRLTLNGGSIIDEFDDSYGQLRVGKWPTMDGSTGIKIISIDPIEINVEDMEVEPVIDIGI